jgi:hypothetical protein
MVGPFVINLATSGAVLVPCCGRRSRYRRDRAHSPRSHTKRRLARVAIVDPSGTFFVSPLLHFQEARATRHIGSAQLPVKRPPAISTFPACQECYFQSNRQRFSEGEEGAHHLRTSPHDRHTIVRLSFRTFRHGTPSRPGSLRSTSAARRWASGFES